MSALIRLATHSSQILNILSNETKNETKFYYSCKKSVISSIIISVSYSVLSQFKLNNSNPLCLFNA